MTPAIILVRPQMGENIGAAARAMQNFGLTDLRIVAPRDGWPNEKALAMAVHAKPIVESAAVYETIEEAIADCTYVVATCSYKRDMPQPVSQPIGLFAEHTPEGMGILFGAERNGLEKTEIAYADRILTIPTAPENHSLNLAQAIAIVCYECYMHAHAVVDADDQEPAAPREELQGMLDQLEAELDQTNFWRVEHKKTAMWMTIRNMIQKAQLTEQEIRTWRGIIRSLRER